MTPAVALELRKHCSEMVRCMAEGLLVPFFGPGVSLLNRTSDIPFTVGKSLPYAHELSLSIAKRVKYPWGDRTNLQRVSWYGARFKPDELYQHLHDVFNAVDTTEVHRFFAELAENLKAKGYRNRRQVIVTANYDRVLDHAFDHAFKNKSEPYDLLTYVANSADKSEVGRFRYKPFGGHSELVDDPSTFPLPITEGVLKHTIILKIQGGADWIEWDKGSFAVNDEDYIDYLARLNTPAHKIPAMLMEKMHDSSFLFLGFGVSEWNLRVVLRGFQSRKKFSHPSWAIMHPGEQWDEAYWNEYGVKLLEVPLTDFIAILKEELTKLPHGGGAGS